MKGFTISAAAEACHGTLNSPLSADRHLCRIVIDSREVCPGDVFAAYRGEKSDGHDYISSALDRGAACCLAERVPEGEERPVILVPNVQKAVEQIAAAWRRTLTLPVVGITGSVGKTSAKEMIAAVLGSRFSVLKTEGNLNNQIGVPMTVSRIEAEHTAAVVEMGISGFGEMSLLSSVARPDIGVFTVIGHAHLEQLHDLDGVFRAKTEMLSFLPDDGTVVVNGDDPYLKVLSCRQTLIRAGLEPDNDVRAEDVEAEGSAAMHFTLVFRERRFPVRIPGFGKHLVSAALEAAAVGFVLGLTDGEIAAGLERFQAVGHRADVEETGFLTMIDDSYNANPDSVKCGLDSLLKLPGRHVALLGDMREMGENALRLHREVGLYAREKGVDLLCSCGDLARGFTEGAGGNARHFDSREELIAALPTLLKRGDAVLVKASRAMRFEEVAEAVKHLEAPVAE